MSCQPELNTLISEIEWLVKNQNRCNPGSQGRLKPCNAKIKDESHTIKMTLDIFVKLHEMLQNYIGLVNFHGPKSRDIGCLKIPLNEALDVAMRAMISAMQSPVPKQTSDIPVCFNCSKTSECSRNRSIDSWNNCDYDELRGINEVDERIVKLKTMNLESVENIEVYIKDILNAIAKLPLTVMTSRLEILSSVVRTMKNKLTSCGRPSVASLMGTQVNRISQIISEFIFEWGEMKSKIYPCRKICRFCNSIICSMDRQRDVFCCENARRLNSLWKEWIQRNSLKGYTKWDEDTIISIVDSFKDSPIVERKRCVPYGPCTTIFSTAEQPGSGPGHQDGEGDDEKNVRLGNNSHDRSKQRNKILSNFTRADKNQGVENHLGIRNIKEKGKVEKQNPHKESQNQVKDRKQITNSPDSDRRNADERGTIVKTLDSVKTSRKKGFKKDAHGADLNVQDNNLGLSKRKKSTKSVRKNAEGDLNPEIKRTGKSNTKKEGKFTIQGFGNTDEPGISRMKSTKKGQDAKNSDKDDKDDKGNIASQGTGDTTFSQQGIKTREKYDEADGKRSLRKEQEIKSSNGTPRDTKNIIQYQLSNELFIKLGWTLLPKDTMMRRVVEFQALLAKPHMNWFENNKNHGTQYYTDKKTIFMKFLKDGSGHVYYPNGETAIAAYLSKKESHEIYKVYSIGGRDIMGVVRLPSLIGVFDAMGNGVIYDEDCNVRLTYNQNGGVYVDNPAKVPFSWGWNNFQTFPIDEAVYQDPLADQVPAELIPAREVMNSSSKTSKQSKSSKAMSSGKFSEDQTVLESKKSMNVDHVKVTKRKVVTPLKPICLKMNKYLSLRILDRKNINLQFFAGQRRVRIELGTNVDPNVQINSELVDRDDWTAKLTNKFHMDVNKMEFNSASMLEISEEIQRVKNEANSRKLMIAKYRPHLRSENTWRYNWSSGKEYEYENKNEI